MICYNCGFRVNDINKKDCQFCGTKFGCFCNVCKSPNPSMAKYCFSCGKPISNIMLNEGLENYTPLSESRKNVAVIFADVSGFTALSERLDPEIVREVINDCFSYITSPVYELGGTIDKYIGDCIMILFGAKTSHADDAKRAVVCGMRMQKLLKEFSEQRLKQLGFSLDISIGIHYGLVVTGGIGNYYDMDYTVMGDTVNTAQRIQANTPAGEVYVSHAVYKETSEDIEYSSPHEFNVKNKKNSITCYSPIKIIKSIMQSNESMPFFGRKSELLIMEAALKHASEGSCELLKIIGGSGIGKTRLLNEFLHSLDEGFKTLVIECNPMGKAKPYALIESMLIKIMNITPEDSAIVKQSRLISYVSYIMASKSDKLIKRNYQFLGIILGLETDNELKEIINSMDADSIFNELINQLNLFFEAYLKTVKGIIVFEDLHWCDSRSLLVLQRLFNNALSSTGYMLYIYTSRKEIDILEGIKHNIKNTIYLENLTNDIIKKITASYIGCSEVDNIFLDYLEKYSGNNPLYIIELLRYLKRNSLYSILNDKAYISNRLEEIPNSIQGLILSKLNDFPKKTIDLIQLASSIGKDFYVAILNNLLQRDIEATGELSLAVKNNLFSLKSTFTSSGRLEKIYTFNHETEREVIYNSILNKQKKIYHKNIGEVIIKLYSKSLDNYLEIVGEHFERAEDFIKAADYYLKAGVKHKKLYNTADALTSFHKTFEIFHKCLTQPNENIYFVCKELGEIYSMKSEYDNAMNYLDIALNNIKDQDSYYLVMLTKAKMLQEQGSHTEAIKILDELQNQIIHTNKLYGTLLFLKCTVLRVIGRPEEALQLIKESERVLKKNSDYENLSKAQNIAGTIYYSMGVLENALKYYYKSYNHADKIRDLQTIIKTTTNIAIIYHTRGDISKAMEYYSIALDISEKISHKRGYITTCNNLGILYMDKGMFGKARELFESAVKNSKEASALLYESASLSNMSDIEYYLGNNKKAEQYAMKAMDISKKINDVEGEGINYIALAKISLEYGASNDSLEYLQQAHAIFEGLAHDDGMCDFYYYYGQYQLLKHEYQAAISNAEISIEYAMKYKSDKKSARALRLKALALQSQNKWIPSIKCLSESIEIFESEESMYEAAKSFYLRAISYKNAGLLTESEGDFSSAQKRIRSIDPCKWTAKIEHEAI